MTDFIKKFNPYLILLLVVIFGYWQIALFTYGLKWDLIDVVFPFRYYFSECIQSGYFPFWNPYLQTGTPFYADLQAPTFYPELLFTSLFSGYGIYTMHILFIAYTFIAGTGMYKLAFHFNQNRLASLIAAISYSFSGYLIGHGQHFFLLVGAAWLPFVLVNYLQLNQNRSIINILKTAVFIFLMVTGAYQALSFTLFYLLVLLFIYFILKEFALKNRQGVFAIIKANVILFFLVVLFLLPLIVSTFEILSSVDRLESGISIEQTRSSGQTLKSIISFLVPFSTLKYGDFFGGVDLSMRNHYFGLFPFLFFIAALLKRRSKTEYLILAFGLVIFASSFSYLPVREFMFRHIPFMNLFKYAAYIRVFGLLAFVLIAANYIAYFQKNFNDEKNKIKTLAIVCLLGLLFLIIYGFKKSVNDDFKIITNWNNFDLLLNNMSFYQHIVVQAIFQFIVVSSFLLILVRYSYLKYPFRLITVVFIVEIVVAAQFNLPVTVGDSVNSPQKMNKDLSLYPKKFPIPVNGKVLFNNRQGASFTPFWRNTFNFSKQVSFHAFSSFELDSYSKLDDDYLNLKDAVINNHLFYFSDKIFPLSQFADSSIDIQRSAKHLYLSEKDYEVLSNKIIATDKADVVDIVEFSPNKVTIKTSTKHNQLLTMLQTNFKGWEARIDNVNTPIYTSNFNYRTIFLPKGIHTVTYKYRNDKIGIFYIISNFLFFVTVLFLLGHAIRKRYPRRKFFIYIPLVFLLVTSFFIFKRLSYNDKNLKAHQDVLERWKDEVPLFHSTLDFENEAQNEDTRKVVEGSKSFHVSSNTEYLTIANIVNSVQKIQKGTLVITAQIFPKSYVEAVIVSEASGENASDKWHGSKIEKQIENLNEWNDILYCRNFYDLNETDIIKVYLWNLNKLDFRIDNITVDIYPLSGY